MNTPTPTEVADLLERAADEIDVRGHAKRRTMREDGTVCEIGALGCAAGLKVRDFTLMSDVLCHPAVAAAYGVMVARCRGFSWQDMDAVTAADVTDELRHAAKDIRNGDQSIGSLSWGIE